MRDIDTEHCQAELGFWIWVECWGKGFAAEAGRAVIDYRFLELPLNRIHAHHMVRNPASGRVLEKLGLKREGLLRQRVRKWSVFEDVILMAILRRIGENKPVRYKKNPGQTARGWLRDPGNFDWFGRSCEQRVTV